jgi:hypothetical protein
MPKKYRTVRVEEDLLIILDQVREDTGIPISRYIKMAVNEKLTRSGLMPLASDKKKPSKAK